MIELPPGYRILEGPENTDFAAAHAMLVDAYWCRGTARERVEKSARGSSLVINVFHGASQVGFARVASDRTTFGWICDVIVHAEHRGRGLGRAMVRYALAHPEHQGFRRWVLATRDAHGVYSECGFSAIENPDNWMAHLPADAPERSLGHMDVV